MFVKRAGAADLPTTDRLLQQIHAENPGHWPHGLSAAHFDGGLYLISKQAGMVPVGFVGWQERDENRRRIGYYSIGVLPEHRNHGYAKRAIGAIMQEKSAGVDEVRAMVVSTNAASKSLALSLPGVTLLEKQAAGKGELLKTLLTGLAGGTSTMLMQDNLMNPDEPVGTQAFNFGENGKGRNLMNIVNFALGAGGAATARKGFQQMGVAGQSGPGAAKVGLGLGTMITGPIIKDLAMDSHKAIHGIDRLSKDLPQAVKDAQPTPFEIPKSLLYGALGLGAAGLGVGGLAAYRSMQANKAREAAARGGRIKVTLPTKNPGDSETTIDMPAGAFPMSQALEGRINRDTRQRLLLETRNRTKHRKPKDPNNLTDAERETQEIEAEIAAEEDASGRMPLAKAGSLSGYFLKRAAAAPTVPSPPAQGTNPALRMTAQAQAAQQAAGGAQTEGNPQIAQAEMAAAGAEQQAQQQMAQAEQAAQAKSMEADQAHQQELAAKDQEVFQAKQNAEIQKTEIEKAKVELELAKAKMEAAHEIEENKKQMTDSLGAAGNSAVQAMTKKRLARIGSLVSKAAATAAVTPPLSAPKPPEEQMVRDGTLNNINAKGFEFMARGGMAPTHLYRTSYGKLGDAAYGMFARPFLNTPSQNSTVDLSSLSPGVMLAQPDAYGALLRQGQQFMNSPR